MTPRKSICFGREAPDLPDPILEQIMSILDFKDVIRASAVSKAWRRAAATLQCLNVSDDFVRPFWDPATSAIVGEKVGSMLISAAVLISKANKQNLPTLKFSCKFRGKSSSLELELIKHLVLLTVNENIREFAVEVRSFGVVCVWDYSLPSSLYAARLLHKVVLGGLKLSLSNIDGIDLPLLRELDLRNNQIDTEFLEQLIFNCPQLVVLNIHDCFGFDALRVLGSHPKLERIDLIKDYQRNARHFLAPGRIEKIEISEAPYLKSFHYKSNEEDSLDVLDLAACKNLKVLELIDFHGNEKLFKSLEQLLSNLNNLESFTMHNFSWSYYDGSKKLVRISSNSLRELRLGFNDYNRADVCVDAPHLSKFVYRGRMHSSMSFETLPIKEANFAKSMGDKTIYKKELLKFLRNFNHFEEVRLDDFAPRHFKGLNSVRGEPDPPLWDVKRLIIGAHHTSDNRYIPVNMEMLEGLLWVAPQLDTLCFDNLKSTLTLEFIHEDAWTMEEAPFMSGNKIWIKVKVVSSPGNAQGWELKKYYLDAEKSMAGFVPLKIVQIMSKKSC